MSIAGPRNTGETKFCQKADKAFYPSRQITLINVLQPIILDL